MIILSNHEDSDVIWLIFSNIMYSASCHILFPSFRFFLQEERKNKNTVCIKRFEDLK
jgi:hypothetical protein